ncbi:MAG: hypothetical protein AAGD11_14965 [Planctomycetota bacterium]
MEISQELDAAICNALQKLGQEKPSTKESPAWKFLNSPFFLSFVAGGFLSVTSLLVTNTLEDRKQQRQQQLSQFDSKTTTLKKFSDGMIRYVDYSLGMMHRAAWLYKQSRESANADESNSSETDDDKPVLTFRDGRSFHETRDYYERQRELARDMEYGTSICVYTKAVYADSSESVAVLKKLEASLRIYEDTWEVAELNKQKAEILKLTAEAADAMSAHLQTLSSR